MVARRRIRRKKIDISSARGSLSQNLSGGGKILPAGCPFSPKRNTTSNPFIQFLHRISPTVTIQAPLTIFFTSIILYYQKYLSGIRGGIGVLFENLYFITAFN
jgi:hypothetical protein